MTLPTGDIPPALSTISEDAVVDLDVRPILRDGGEPFSQIMDAAATVPGDGALRLRATFKPTPLFGVMRMRGFKHWIEHGEGDDWIIWFYR
jgi:hypothetical protein